MKDYRIEASSSEEDRVAKMHEDGPVDIRVCDDIPTPIQSGQEEEICRVCYKNTNEKENPMLSACKCTGSMKFMHFSCIKTWMNLKYQEISLGGLATYFWKSFECEICKTIYPCT